MPRTSWPAVARIFGVRYGLALVLVVAIVAIVGAAQLLGGTDDLGGLRNGAEPGIASSVNPSAGDDGEADPPPTPTPATSPGAPSPQAAAVTFATNWLNHRNTTSEAWLSRLRPLITSSLATQLAGADPAGVPADRITGEARSTPRGDSLVEVAIPIDSGTLRLRMVAEDGRWLVDGIDWERA